MRHWRDVWILTIACAVGGVVFVASVWQTYGPQMRSGAMGNLALGLYATSTFDGDAMWLPYVTAAVVFGGVAYMAGRTNLIQRRAREQAPTHTHPMD